MAASSSVQKKIACVMNSRVIEEPSSKRSYQSYRVVAGNDIRDKARQADVFNAKATEKLDGTCVYIAEYEGKPWLWARYDRKPNKMTERKFRKFQTQHHAWELNKEETGDSEPTFQWNLKKDLKEVPATWIPASGVEVHDGVTLPDEHGHIPGWTPVDPSSRQHCWHLNAVDLDAGLAVVLQIHPDNPDQLQLKIANLRDYLNCTMELVGTHINANPYKLGSKKNPLHFLICHGVIPVRCAIPIDITKLKEFFADNPSGRVEGIVWHCGNGELFKIHRHHLDLPWPIENPLLSNMPVSINTNINEFENECITNSQLYILAELHGKELGSVREVMQDSVDIA